MFNGAWWNTVDILMVSKVGWMNCEEDRLATPFQLYASTFVIEL